MGYTLFVHLHFSFRFCLEFYTFTPSKTRTVIFMQKRHQNRGAYFNELSITSKNYFIPYINRFKTIEAGMNVLEIGCGEGGNLLPLSQMGCHVTGVDMAASRIEEAIQFFADNQAKGDFIASDIFLLKHLEASFDVIICHDVYEHLDHKAIFLSNLQKYLKPDGFVFISFPAWQMPFGGHQQICRNKLLSHFPFIHLLPRVAYKRLLQLGGESSDCIEELLHIKETRASIEPFEALLRDHHVQIIDRTLYFINPHYEIKFGLKPRLLSPFFAAIPYLRNFLTTSCFYIIKPA